MTYKEIDKVNIMELHAGAAEWYVHYIGPHSKRIMELFKTTRLPTPYSNMMPIEKVIAELSAKNPGVVVR